MRERVFKERSVAEGGPIPHSWLIKDKSKLRDTQVKMNNTLSESRAVGDVSMGSNEHSTNKGANKRKRAKMQKQRGKKTTK